MTTIKNLKRRHFLKHSVLASLAPTLYFNTESAHAKISKSTIKSKARIVILGGGYAGATAARYLKQRAPQLSVDLVEANQYYYSALNINRTISAHGISTPQQHTYQRLQKKYAITIHHQKARSANFSQKRIELEDNRQLAYDFLIIALGSGLSTNTQAYGYNQQAQQQIPHALRTKAQALLLQQQISKLADNGLLLFSLPKHNSLYPLFAYERISLAAHYLKHHKPQARIRVLDAGTGFPPLLQRLIQAWEQLYGFNSEHSLIELIRGNEAKISKLEPKQQQITTIHKEKHRADCINIMPSLQAHPLTQQWGLSDASGWCPIDPRRFESNFVSDVFIIGDAAHLSPLPKTAANASVSARLCAINLLRRLQNKSSLEPFWLHHCYNLVSPHHGLSLLEHYRINNSHQKPAVISQQPSAKLNSLATNHTSDTDHPKLTALYAQNRQRQLSQQAFD